MAGQLRSWGSCRSASFMPRQWLHYRPPPLPTPHGPAQEGLCGSNATAADAFWQRLRRDCSLVPPLAEAAGLGATELPPQHLFTIYAHAPPDYQGGLPFLLHGVD